MAASSKIKTNKKRKFTVVNLLQVLTVVGLLVYMQVAVDSGKVQKVFLASPTSIVKKGIEIITDGTLAPHLLVTLEEVAVGYKNPHQ